MSTTPSGIRTTLSPVTFTATRCPLPMLTAAIARLSGEAPVTLATLMRDTPSDNSTSAPPVRSPPPPSEMVSTSRPCADNSAGIIANAIAMLTAHLDCIRIDILPPGPWSALVVLRRQRKHRLDVCPPTRDQSPDGTLDLGTPLATHLLDILACGANQLVTEASEVESLLPGPDRPLPDRMQVTIQFPVGIEHPPGVEIVDRSEDPACTPESLDRRCRCDPHQGSRCRRLAEQFQAIGIDELTSASGREISLQQCGHPRLDRGCYRDRLEHQHSPGHLH